LRIHEQVHDSGSASGIRRALCHLTVEPPVRDVDRDADCAKQKQSQRQQDQSDRLPAFFGAAMPKTIHVRAFHLSITPQREIKKQCALRRRH
jgi:hypothetical protein